MDLRKIRGEFVDWMHLALGCGTEPFGSIKDMGFLY
jgi:hypothetical protein